MRWAVLNGEKFTLGVMSTINVMEFGEFSNYLHGLMTWAGSVRLVDGASRKRMNDQLRSICSILCKLIRVMESNISVHPCIHE